MKVSEITPSEVAKYLRIDDYDDAEIALFIESSKSFIKSYTGLTEAEIDTLDDMAIAVYLLCQDMNDNRATFTEKPSSMNRTLEYILDMHSKNFL